MKHNYVHGYRYIPLWDTEIIFNRTDSGYYEKFIIGLAKDRTDDYFLVPIIQSCGNGCGDNRLLLEDDDSVDRVYYLPLIEWIHKKILELDKNQSMFAGMIDELRHLIEWVNDEYEAKKNKEEE